MRVLQRGEVVATLTEVKRQGDKLTGLWTGALPAFAPGEQLEPWTLESEGGFKREEGLFLYRIWDLHEGRARVELGREEGAPPWRRSTTPSAPPRGPEPEIHPGELATHKARILVVDDDEETRETVATALEIEGFEVDRAASGPEALELMARGAPDVAVVDLIMPEMSGQELCLSMRRDPRLRGSRLLVLSGAEDTRLAAAESDADSAIIKPFTVELLLAEVRRLLGV